MQFYGRASEAAARIVALIKSGDVPKALAPMFIHRNDNTPCRAWSWNNQLLTALAGFDDARGFRQWQAVNRHVKKGERAFSILAPCTRKVTTTDDETGQPVGRVVVVGFRSQAVFGYEQTDGEPLPDRPESDAFIDALPVVGVARHWGLSVSTFNGKGARYQGFYKHGQAIALGVENLSVWAHELIHAADDRLGTITKRSGQQLDNEIVAELGGAVLLACLGRESDADYGGCWRYVSAYATRAKKPTIAVIEKLLRRTCDAVALVMQTADELVAQPTETVAA